LLDTNIGRIIERVFTVKVTGEERKKSKVWEIIATYVPKDNSREYNYALIDFGALVCTARNPRHDLCPLAEMCDYYYMAKINNEYSTKHSSRCKRLT
jgi:A/G-specific adenine glycosylase